MTECHRNGQAMIEIPDPSLEVREMKEMDRGDFESTGGEEKMQSVKMKVWSVLFFSPPLWFL